MNLYFIYKSQIYYFNILLLIYIFILATTVSAISLPIQPRAEACEQLDDIFVFDDGPTSDHTAGIGFEFESAGFRLNSRGCSEDDTNASKGEVIADRQGTNWKLTADTGADPGVLQAEYIFDGTQIKVGSGDAERAGEAAVEDLKNWSPWDQPPATVNVANSKCNPWKIVGIRKGTKADSLPWSPQATAPMPLEALYELMQENEKNLVEPNSPLVGGTIHSFPPIVVKQDYFKSSPNGIKESEVSNDVLAFCSLVMAYAKAATFKQKKDFSPKLLTVFIPRTEFNTIFRQVKSKIPGDLFTLFNILACYKSEMVKGSDPNDPSFETALDTNYCSGNLAKPVPNGKFESLTWESFKENIPNVNIKEWIQGIGVGSPSPDLLTKFDASIDGSIGGLGTAMEKMYNSQRSVPLFEFRDLDLALKTSGIPNFMARVDTAIQQLHAKYATAPRRMKRQAGSACLPEATSTFSRPTVSKTAAPSISCYYGDATPENGDQAACTCISGSSTTVVPPMTLSSVSEITQSCGYSTWPSNKPTVTAPPQTVITNFPGCQVCTVIGPNEDNCSPLPLSLGCIPAKTSTVLSADTQGVTVGTLTGSALFSAITSGIDKVCQIPLNTGGGTGTFTCNEDATATIANNIRYTHAPMAGQDEWDTEGELTLQITEASYDSLAWYSTNKVAIAAFAQNSTQNNCKSIKAWSGLAGVSHHETYSICKVGSNFQLIEFDPTSKRKANELSFNLKFQAQADSDILCLFIEDVVEFIEDAINVATDTEGLISGELLVDQELLEACEGQG